jgi:hypothetical protein
MPDNENEEDTKRGGFNWIGLLLFLVVVGAQFAQPLLNTLSQFFMGQATAAQLGSSLSSFLPLLIGGLVVLFAVVPLLMSILRGLGSLTSTNDIPARIQMSSDGPGLPPSMRHMGGSSLNYSGMESYQQGDFTHTLQKSNARTQPRPYGMDLDKLAAEGMRTKQEYQAPGFEPIVSGKVVLFGILAAVLLLVGLSFGNWLSALLP